MVNELYESALNGAYEKHYTADNGRCKHFAECSKDQNTCKGLFCNRAKLGTHYGNGEHLKVLVVGKEPVTENRGITKTASLEEANNPHYRRTLYTLATILKKEPASDCFEDLVIYDELLDYFCLTNYFKCSFTETEETAGVKRAKKNSNVKTNSFMKNQCGNILLDEIKALKPDIVIMQGKSYSSSFWETLQNKEYYGKNLLSEEHSKKCKGLLTKHQYNNGSPLYIVWAYHPTARASFAWKRQLKHLSNTVQILQEVLTLDQ